MEQRLTPQLIQSMAILQKPVAELEATINDALESNAALELVEPAPEVQLTDGGDGRPPRTPEDADASSFGRLERYVRAFDPEFNETDRAPHPARRIADSGERDAKLAAMANTAGRDPGLHDYLLEQWRMLELPAEVSRAGEVIIGRLELDGYLRQTLGEVAEAARPPLPVDAAEKALSAIRELDPPGIGASDLRECLLLQVDRLPGDNRIERTLIENHLDDIAHNRLPQIAKTTGFLIGEINEALRVIRTQLRPHPGSAIGDHGVPPIRPDVIVDFADTGGGLVVRLARGNMPELRIRDDVSELVKSREADRTVREFARKHIESATALIDAVNFRRSRLLDVARAIVEKQRDFFDVGPSGLKVLRMSDLATELACDPSTVSRTVADKHMQTPRGIVPLRYFFTGGMETSDGETLGWDRVKTRVKELVDAEDRNNPLSDDQIAEALEKEGMSISRRTVAKYRAQLDIPTARQRRVY